jgi:hypothetical protein
MYWVVFPLAVLALASTCLGAMGLSSIWSLSTVPAGLVSAALHGGWIAPREGRHAALRPFMWFACVLLARRGLLCRHSHPAALSSAVAIEGLTLLLTLSAAPGQPFSEQRISLRRCVDVLTRAFSARPAAQPHSADAALERVAAPPLHDAGHQLRGLADPARVSHSWWPWSKEAKALREARDLALRFRLDSYKEDLDRMRDANGALARTVTHRAEAASEAARFDLQCTKEAARFAAVNRTRLQMTRQFLDQLAFLDGLADPARAELFDALKERALNDFAEGVDRASREDRPRPETPRQRQQGPRP